MIEQKLYDQLDLALSLIKKAGIADARVAIDSGRVFQLKTKNGQIELLKESHSGSLSMRLFNNGHSGGFSTSDLRPEALEAFIGKAAEMVALTDINPAYSLPPAERGGALPDVDLAQVDEVLLKSKKGEAQAVCEEISRGAREEAPKLVLVDAAFQEVHSVNLMATTKGFKGSQEATYIALSTEVNVEDEGGKKQNGWDDAIWFKYGQMKNIGSLGRTAARRALDMLGSQPIATDDYQIIIDKYHGGKIIGWFLQALDGANLYRQMSCFKDKIGQKVAPDFLSIRDDPFVPGGLASACYDAEGMVNRPWPIIENGVLRNFYISNYWGNKLQLPPTTGEATNLLFSLGNRSGEEMAQAATRCLFITGFLGGNFNPLTGDFSTGIRGFLYENGQRVCPVTEMNLAGNLLELFDKLEELGNDPCPFEAIGCPAMRFAPMKVAGRG